MADKFALKAVISASAGGLMSTLKQVNQATKTTRKYIGDLGSSTSNLAAKIGLPLGLVSTALGAFSLAGLKQTLVGFADMGGQIDDTARGIGVTGVEFQRLSYLFQMAGVDASVAASSVGRLNAGIAAAATGKNKDLAALFRRAGISLRGANGQLRSGADLLPEVAELFERNGNAAVQARMGNALFGKSWQSLAPLLNDGAEGIKTLTERYKALGLGISEEDIARAAELGDKIDDLGLVTKSYGYTIAGKLLPVVMPMIERTIQWAAANRELITTRVSSFIAEMGRYISAIDWNGVVQGANSLVKEVRDLVAFVGGARNALIGLVLFMNASAIVATLALAGSVIRASWALGALTVTTIPAAVAALGTLSASMVTAGTAANALLGLLGKVAAIAGAGFVGWQIGTRLNDMAINPLARWLTGDKEATLGTALYDMFNKDVAADITRPSIVTQPSSTKVGGEVKISFEGAPAGMRVDRVKNNGAVPLNLDVGHHSTSLGLSY